MFYLNLCNHMKESSPNKRTFLSSSLFRSSLLPGIRAFFFWVLFVSGFVTVSVLVQIHLMWFTILHPRHCGSVTGEPKVNVVAEDC